MIEKHEKELQPLLPPALPATASTALEKFQIKNSSFQMCVMCYVLCVQNDECNVGIILRYKC